MRNFGQFCPIARGSGILAERWTPIILRNVLLGCRTFSEIAAGAPGLSRALLTRRLRELARAGLIEIRPKAEGRGSWYEPTRAGRDLWPVLQALSGWAQQWMEVTAEDADPDVVVWSWCEVYLARDRLPDHRVVVRFELPHRGRPRKLWLLIERGEGEICGFDPGFGEDIVVRVRDALLFARWHLGLVDWRHLLRDGAVEVDGPTALCRQLPTWNDGPSVHARKRAEHARAPGGPQALPRQAGPAPVRLPPGVGVSRSGTASSQIAGFQGELITAGHPDYDSARAVWNGAIDRKPRAIARCLSPADVAAVLAYASDHSLAVTVRGGGHGVAGSAVCDDGVVVDLAPMRGIQVDPLRRTARVEGGVLWGELDAVTQAFGLATTGGVVSHTGVAGLTLGGGIGWLMRRHGLTVDNLLGVELVTAAGERLTVDERNHPELFWGLRGGGAGLGVVTSFTYRLHPAGPEVLAGPVLWALEDGPEVLAYYREFCASAPPEVATIVMLRQAPPAPFLPVELHRRPVCQVAMLALAPPAEAERLLAPMRTFGRPLLDLVRYRRYTDLQSMVDPTVPHGWHYYWKSTGLRGLDDPVVDALVERAAMARSPWSYTVMFQTGGAVAEADPDGTAYGRRDIAYELNINAVWLPGQPVGEADSAWARGFLGALAPHHTGVYLNFLDRDDHDRAPEAFAAATWRRLADLRSRYDPDQLLRPARLS